jgi:hypothetical protein
MADKHPKRPRDLSQWAKRIVDIVSGKETQLSKKTPRPAKKAQKDQAEGHASETAGKTSQQ